MNIVLQTPRLQIRPFTRKDTDAIFAIYSDEDTNTFLPWFPVRTRAEAERVYEERYAASGKSAGFALPFASAGRPSDMSIWTGSRLTTWGMLCCPVTGGGDWPPKRALRCSAMPGKRAFCS